MTFLLFKGSMRRVQFAFVGRGLPHMQLEHGTEKKTGQMTRWFEAGVLCRNAGPIRHMSTGWCWLEQGCSQQVRVRRHRNEKNRSKSPRLWTGGWISWCVDKLTKVGNVRVSACVLAGLYRRMSKHKPCISQQSRQLQAHVALHNGGGSFPVGYPVLRQQNVLGPH